MAHRVAVITLATMLAACSLLPRVPEMTKTEVLAKAASDTDTTVDLDTAKKLLSGWRVIYSEAADSRRKWQLGFGEALFYGSIFAVLGAITNHDHARNLGIAVSGGSSLGSGHYQLSAQLGAFRKAIGKLSCIEEATMQITPRDERDFPGITDAQSAALRDLPARTMNRIGKIRKELGETLNGIELATPSKDEIAGVVKRWYDAKNGSVPTSLTSTESAVGRPTGLVDPADDQRRQRELEIRKNRFTAALDKVNEEIDLCMADSPK